jgi:hypothetical protein
MPYIEKALADEAKQMDLLTYLRIFEPFELVHIGNGTYKMRSHSSLKISNGKWYWWSEGIGGPNAVSYLMAVENYSFTDAVEKILGQRSHIPAKLTTAMSEPQVTPEKVLILPTRHKNSDMVYEYLTGRGISRTFAAGLIHAGKIYESKRGSYTNAVFVGSDAEDVPRYAALRGIGTDYKGEAKGSDKHFSFSIPPKNECRDLHVFESAIDLLSYATIAVETGEYRADDYLLSLGGTSQAHAYKDEYRLPPALRRVLNEHSEIQTIYLRLDEDDAGWDAGIEITSKLPVKIESYVMPPPRGKDYNEYLQIRRAEQSSRQQKHER